MTARVRPLPATVDFDSLGGSLSNYAPVEDPTVDLDAAFDNATRANVAACSYTITRAFVTFATSLIVLRHGAVWGDSPLVAPVITNPSAGVYIVTWPTTVTDQLGDPAAPVFVFASATARDVPLLPYVSITAPNVVSVKVYDLSTGALSTLATTIDLWCR